MPLPSQLGVITPAGDPGRFSILAVCTGNLCRSPLLEQLLRVRLSDELPGMVATVTSAGTHAVDGQPMDSDAVREAERLGVPDAAAHRAQRLTEQLIASADLVLAMTREHRSVAVHLAPRTNGRVFTLGEFATVVSALVPDQLASMPGGQGTPESCLRSVVAAAHTLRGVVAWQGSAATPQGSAGVDVPDPYRCGQAAHRAAADAVDGHVIRLFRVLPGLMDVGTSAGTRPKHYNPRSI